MPGKLLDEFREFKEPVVFQAGVNPVQGEQRHGSFFHGSVAGALSQSEYCRMNHLDALRERHNRVGHAHSEIHVEMSFQPLVDARFHRPYKVWNGMRREHAKSVHQRERVHVAFVSDAQDQIENPFHFRASKINGEKYDFEPLLVGESGRLDGKINGLLHRPFICILDDVLAGRHLHHDAGNAAI